MITALKPWGDGDRSYRWTAAVLFVSAPFLLILCGTLWRTPFPLTEAVAIFEDVATRPPSRLLVPEASYYRPLFYLTLSAIWNHAGSLPAALASIRLLQIVPVVLLLVLFIWHLRLRTALDAAAAAVAVAVLVGSRGFRDNLELPLSYTIVGMPLALLVWMLLNRRPRIWQGPAIVLLTLVAVGFKEQGLVIVPLIVAAWWMRAPGASRGLAVTVSAFAVVYVVVRLIAHTSGPMFEQAIGFGFSEMEPPEATARFAAFPYWIYAYNGLSTMLNVLLSEPTRGTFRVVRDVTSGGSDVWEFVQVGSSAALTVMIGWWGLQSVRHAARHDWSLESRTFIAMLVVLLACGLLSFDYSRDRLGGMAAVFYALAGFCALRAAAAAVLAASPRRFVAAGLALMLLSCAWQSRAITTIEFARIVSFRNQEQWLVLLPDRRREFADRPVYLRIMQTMIDQGADPSTPRPTLYPRWVRRTLGLP